MRSFLLTFDTEKITRTELINVIDRIKGIENWYAFFEGSIVVASPLGAKEISKLIRKQLPDTPFLLAEVQREGRGGWLPRSVWSFINDPKPVKELAS